VASSSIVTKTNTTYPYLWCYWSFLNHSAADRESHLDCRYHIYSCKRTYLQGFEERQKQGNICMSVRWESNYCRVIFQDRNQRFSGCYRTSRYCLVWGLDGWLFYCTENQNNLSKSAGKSLRFFAYSVFPSSNITWECLTRRIPSQCTGLLWFYQRRTLDRYTFLILALLVLALSWYLLCPLVRISRFW